MSTIFFAVGENVYALRRADAEDSADTLARFKAEINANKAAGYERVGFLTVGDAATILDAADIDHIENELAKVLRVVATQGVNVARLLSLAARIAEQYNLGVGSYDIQGVGDDPVAYFLWTAEAVDYTVSFDGSVSRSSHASGITAWDWTFENSTATPTGNTETVEDVLFDDATPAWVTLTVTDANGQSTFGAMVTPPDIA